MLIVLRNLLIAAAAAAFGLALGVMLTRGATWPVTMIGLSFYALVIFANPLAGLLLWIVTAPFSRFVYLDVVLGRGIPDLTLTRICAGLLLVIVLAQLAIGKLRAPRLTLLDGALLATLLGIGLSLPAALDGLKYAVTSYADTYAVPAVIYFLARFLVRKRAHAEAVCTAFVILGVVLTTVAVQEQLSDGVLFVYSERSWVYTRELHKLAGLLGSPAFFAALISMCAGFTVYRFAHARSAAGRITYGLLIPYLALGVYYTYNRAGYISLGLSLLLAALVWPQLRRGFVVAAVAVGFALALSWGAVQQSAVVAERLSARGPVDYRLEIWGNAAQILAHEPLLGLGYSNFGRVYLRYNPSWEYATVLPAPHNSVLEVAFNTGIIGVAPYLMTGFLIVTGIVGMRRRARSDPDSSALIAAFGIGLVPYLVEAMVIDMVSAYYVNMVMMLAVGALFGWQAEETNAGSDSRAVPNGHFAAGRS
jgi:O-antigen ligase